MTAGTALTGVALLLPWVVAIVSIPLDGRRRGPVLLAVAGLLGSLVVQGALAVVVATGGPVEIVTGRWDPGVGIVLSPDVLGVTFSLVSLAVMLAALLTEAASGVREPRFPALLMLLATGLTGLFLTGDVFSFYVFFELAMMASYALAAYRGGRRELRAAVVFAAVNLLGTFVFLIAVAGTYRITGSLAMSQVAAAFREADEQPVLLLAVAYFVAFGLKLGLFPFSFWLPIVYVESRPAVAAVLAGAVANIGAYGILRFGVGLLPEAVDQAAGLLVGLGCASILYGGLLALRREDPVETFAYSAIGQVGYVLVGVGVGGPLGLAAAVAYSVVNAVTKALLFLCIGRRSRFAAAAAAIGALSVAGIPPAVGFLAKYQVVRSGLLLEGGWPVQALVLAVLAAGSVLSIVYMAERYATDVWAGTARAHPAPGKEPPPSSRDGAGPAWQARERRPGGADPVLVVLAATVLAAGVWPQSLLSVADAATRDLTAASEEAAR